MKLAISTDKDMVSGHFGRCSSYTIVVIEDNQVSEKYTVETPPHQPGFLPGFLQQQGVNCVITGGMGPRAQTLFQQMSIEPIIGVSGRVEDVIQDYIHQRLERGESRCTQDSDHHHNCGGHEERD